MEFLIPDWLSTDEPVTPIDLDAIFSGATALKMTLLVKNPNFAVEDNDRVNAPGTINVAHITAISLLSDLLARPEWQELNDAIPDQDWHTLAEPESDISVADQVVGGTRTVSVAGGDELGTFYFWPEKTPCVATGLVLSLVGGARNGYIVEIIRFDQPLYLTGESELISTRIGVDTSWLTYTETNGVDGALGWDVTHGDPYVVVPTMEWETARCAHVWIDPQRINYVINPSFRNNSIGWRSDAVISFPIGGVKRDGGSRCLMMDGPDPVLVLESNFFPVNAGATSWSVSAEVAGTGRVRIGIVFFPPSMAEEDVVYVHLPWQEVFSDSEGRDKFIRVHGSFPTPETVKEGVLRIEFEGDRCWVDEVLAAPEDGPGTYFDAAFPMGQYGDYSWYGGSGSFANKSYSLFYNNRRNLNNLMFGYTEYPPGTPAPPPVRHRGEAEKWVPEGVNLVPHWDDVFSTRVHTWMDDVVIPPEDYTTAFESVVTVIPPPEEP